MKNRMKKLLCMSIAMSMAAGTMLTGCGSSESSEKSSEAESSVQNSSAASSEAAPAAPEEEASKEIVFPLADTMEFSCFSIMTDQYELSDSLALQEALTRANITLDMTSVPVGESAEKSSLLIASGDYPDMFFKGGSVDYTSAAEDGVIIPLEDLIKEYAPHVKQLLDERNAWAAISDADGHVWTMPMFMYSTIITDNPMWINQKWLDNLGLDMPTDLDSLYEVLKAFKEQDADGDGDTDNELPLVVADGALSFLQVYSEDAFFFPQYGGEVTEDNNLEFYYNKEGYKEFLEYCRKLYTEGLMSEEAFTQTSDEAIATSKANNNVGAFFSFASNGMVADEFALDYVCVDGFNAKGVPCNAGLYTGGMAITDKCENPEVLVAWADYFYTPEGAILADMGIEGETYKINEDGSYNWIKDRGEAYGKPKDVIQGGAIAPMLVPDFRFNVNPKEDPINAHVYSSRMAVYNAGTILPKLALTAEETDKVTDRWVEITDYVSSYAAEAVTGIISLEDTWDDYVKTLDNMKIDEIYSVYQDAWKRATSN